MVKESTQLCANDEEHSPERPIEQQTKSDAAFGVNTNPLSERQVRVLRTVYPEVRNALLDGEQVWAGLPLRPLLRGDAQGRGNWRSIQREWGDTVDRGECRGSATSGRDLTS